MLKNLETECACGHDDGLHGGVRARRVGTKRYEANIACDEIWCELN
jgi:hypothetical protein